MAAAGDVLRGKYRLLRGIGEGGMGQVFEAEHLHTDAHVAIKRLHADGLDHGSARRRFLREARASARVGHRDIVEAYGLDMDDSGAVPFIVQELLTALLSALTQAAQGVALVGGRARPGGELTPTPMNPTEGPMRNTMNARRCLRLAAMGLCAALTAAEASAQTISEADRAARVDLLARAQAAHRAGQFDEALRFVGQAERIGVTAGTSLLTARIHATAGHPAAALASVERCVREVDLDGQTTAANRQALRTACEGLRAEVAPRVAHLTVRVPAGAPAGLVVQVNGEIVRPANYGAAQAVDPGRLRVVATVQGRPPWERLEIVSAGASATVDVVVPAAPVDTPPRVERPVAPPPPPPVMVVPEGAAGDAPAPSGSAQRTLGIVSGALGVGLLATGVVGGLMFRNTEGEYSTAGCASQASPNAGCYDHYGTLETLNTVQWVGYVGGGLLVATGAILLLTAPSRASAAPRVSVGLTPGGATLGYAGSF